MALELTAPGPAGSVGACCMVALGSLFRRGNSYLKALRVVKDLFHSFLLTIGNASRIQFAPSSEPVSPDSYLRRLTAA
jgi:hypothetical protein